MEGIWELIVTLTPLLFSGAVAGAFLSYLTPTIIKKLKSNIKRKKVETYYRNYTTNPGQFEKVQPQIKQFFDNKGWEQCSCPNCAFIKKKWAKPKKQTIQLASASAGRSKTAYSAIGKLISHMKFAKKHKPDEVSIEVDSTNKH